MPHSYAIGIDFGTASARTLLLNLSSGEEEAVSEDAYEHGVIDEVMPASGERLPLDWALHDPADYTAVIEAGVKSVLGKRPGVSGQVVGIGVDATSCTVLPAAADGTPLCQIDAWATRPHAWPKLWKHHAAQPVANRLNEVAAERGEKWLARYGGRISSEWYFPKLIELWLEDREIYNASASFVEVTDWVVWQLSGHLRRSACPAAYKALWSPDGGVPGREFFEAAYPGFSRPSEKLGQDFYPLGTNAGHLSPEWAGRLGLPESVAVAVGNVDSFVSFPGAGAEGAGKWVMVVGTSTCDMVVHSTEVPLAGITGVARDGILPGLYGYEAGQPAVGDMLGWFAATLGDGTRGVGALLSDLERAAGRLAPGATGLVALDWWNGNRSVLGDADLSGALVGLTLQTSQDEMYRALLESIAFGNRAVLDNFRHNGFAIEEVVACGGVAERSPLLMQLFADTSGLPVAVPASQQVPARGAALFGAVAAGAEAGGYGGVQEAAAALRPGTARTYRPDPAATSTYESVYAVWKGLHDMLGRDKRAWLYELKRLKRLQAGGGRDRQGT